MLETLKGFSLDLGTNLNFTKIYFFHEPKESRPYA